VDFCYLLIFSIEIISEQYYRGIQEDPELKVKLTGNWETLVGEQDTFIHITEYENYGGYDKATQIVRTSEVSITFHVIAPPGSQNSLVSIMSPIKQCFHSFIRAQIN
jgi:hypothetical protein